MPTDYDKPAAYDMSIHTNPDAVAWAKFFMECKNKGGWEVDEEVMRGWFANAMMAMHDFMEIQRRKTIPVAPVEPPKEWKREFLTETPQEFRARTTTDGKPPVPGYETASAPGPIDPKTGQHTAYWVLSEEDRKKGWVRPLRRKYKHKKCGCVTSMGLALCETYAKDPKFYGATFCVGCGDHFPVSEFIWDEDGTEVGS